MTMSDSVQPGLQNETSYLVGEQHTATQVGSGAVMVLATPVLIGFMERTCHQLLAGHLAPGASSVGVNVNVSHLAPTPLGATVKVQCEITRVEGNQVTFYVQAWDEMEKVSEGEHVRVVNDQERFLKRVARKASTLGLG